MDNLRYGMKEVANVIFFDITTGKPVLFFDTLKVSTIDNEAEEAESRGGQGNNKLISWSHSRTANLTISDALLSDIALSMMAGSSIKKENVSIVGREQLTVVAGTVTLKHAPTARSVNVYLYRNGLISQDLNIQQSDITDRSIAIGEEHNNKEVMVFYEYILATGSSQIVFSGNKFPSVYRVVGDTFVRGENGRDQKMQFMIPKAKLQTAFSLTMDVENVSTFDFTLEVLTDSHSKNKNLYTVTRMGNPLPTPPQPQPETELDGGSFTAQPTETVEGGAFDSELDEEEDGGTF